MSRRTNALTDTNYPIVSVQRFQPLQCEVNVRQLEELGDYVRYVESVSGDKPTAGEVIGAALAELFKLDRGFQKWKDQAHRPDGRAHKASEVGPAGKA